MGRGLLHPQWSHRCGSSLKEKSSAKGGCQQGRDRRQTDTLASSPWAGRLGKRTVPGVVPQTQTFPDVGTAGEAGEGRVGLSGGGRRRR